GMVGVFNPNIPIPSTYDNANRFKGWFSFKISGNLFFGIFKLRLTAFKTKVIKKVENIVLYLHFLQVICFEI
ncbi:unnamed protein product, partial [marine sediment metagenome]